MWCSEKFRLFWLTLKWSRSILSCSLRPHGCSLPGSSIHGILQARILEWVAISFSRGSSWLRNRTQVSCTAGRRFNLWATRKPWLTIVTEKWASHVILVAKNPASEGDSRDMSLIPGSGRAPGGGNGNLLQYSCLENPMDRGAWGGYSLWGCKDSDMAEHTAHTQSKSYLLIG